MNNRPERLPISVVIPVYRSEESLPILLSRLLVVLRGLDRPFEVILVDDCSPDRSWEILNRLKEEHGNVLRIAKLLTNSGQHNAILCGFSLAGGGIVVTMDDDLQNPPEEVPKLVDAIDRGFDLAIGAYGEKHHAQFRNLGGRMIDSIQRRIFRLPQTFQLTSFRAIRGIVVESVRRIGGSAYPYVTSLLLSQTANVTNVDVRHDARPFGRSTYTLKRSLSLAANLIVSYSAYPLLIVGALCVAAFLIAAGAAVAIFVSVMRYGASVPGWASTVLIIACFNSLILLSLAILGIYISRLHRQLSRLRVDYTIRDLR